MDAANAPGRDELRESGDEIHGVPECGVLLKPWVVAGVIKHLAAGRVIGEFLQRQGSPGNVLSEGLSGFVIATIKAHRVVDGEPGVFPTQEGLSEALRDEAQLKEEADGAPAQALGQGSGIVDGQVVDCPEESNPPSRMRAWKCGLNRSESPKGWN